MHNDMKRMGKIIQSARAAKRITQTALADQIEASLRTIIAIENGQRNPTFEVLYRIIHALDIPADLIFHPDDVTNTPEQEQFVREFLSYTEQEQQIVMDVARCLARGLENYQSNI
jgi:transcriptional regulator with XRE-family HTH domain